MQQNTGLIERIVKIFKNFLEKLLTLFRKSRAVQISEGIEKDRDKPEGEEFSIMPDSKRTVKSLFRVIAIVLLLSAMVLTGWIAYMVLKRTGGGDAVTVEGIMKKKTPLLSVKVKKESSLKLGQTPVSKTDEFEKASSLQVSARTQKLDIQQTENNEIEEPPVEPSAQIGPKQTNRQEQTAGDASSVAVQKSSDRQSMSFKAEKHIPSGYMNPFEYEADPEFAGEMENLYREYQRTMWISKIAKYRAEIAEANKKIREAEGQSIRKADKQMSAVRVKKEPAMKTAVWKLPVLEGVMIGEKYKAAILSDGRSVTVDMEIYPGLRVVEIQKDMVVCQDQKGRLYRITPATSDSYVVKLPVELAKAYGVVSEEKTQKPSRIPVRIPVRR
jgi:hypothetical protein